MGISAVATKVLGYSDSKINRLIENSDIFDKLNHALPGTSFVGLSSVIFGLGIGGMVAGVEQNLGLMVPFLLAFALPGGLMAASAQIKTDQLENSKDDPKFAKAWEADRPGTERIRIKPERYGAPKSQGTPEQAQGESLRALLERLPQEDRARTIAGMQKDIDSYGAADKAILAEFKSKLDQSSEAKPAADSPAVKQHSSTPIAPSAFKP